MSEPTSSFVDPSQPAVASKKGVKNLKKFVVPTLVLLGLVVAGYFVVRKMKAGGGRMGRRGKSSKADKRRVQFEHPVEDSDSDIDSNSVPQRFQRPQTGYTKPPVQVDPIPEQDPNFTPLP